MEILPSLGRVAVARSFDPRFWPSGTVMDGDEVLVGGVPCARLADGSPSSSSVLVRRVTRLVRSGPVVLCDVAGPIPQHQALGDVAGPGARLAGARMRHLLIRGADGARLAARVEVPADVALDAMIVLALTAPQRSAPGLRSARVECDESAGPGRWTTWNIDPRRAS